MCCISKTDRRCGFTLLELLLAVGILAAVMVVTFMAFSTVIQAWKKGRALVENVHHGDFVIDQLVMALRSAYFVKRDGDDATFGFWLEDNGDGPESSDEIGWVKLGSSLVGADAPFVDSPHRVQFSVDEDDEGRRAVKIRAWRTYGQPEDFDPEDDVEPQFLSRRVVGFNCRPAYPYRSDPEEEIEWLDEWEHSNSIPTVVEITLFLEPLEEGGEPVEVRRIVGIPVAPLSLPDKPW